MRLVVRGLDELLRKLQDLPKEIRQKELMDATLKAGEPIKEEMEARAPVDTGLLAASGGMEAIPSPTDALTARVHVGPESQAFYGLFQEFGTEHHEEQEFLGPAFEAKKKEAEQIVASELKKTIDKWVQSHSDK